MNLQKQNVNELLEHDYAMRENELLATNRSFSRLVIKEFLVEA